MHTFADMVGLGAIAVGLLVAGAPFAVTVKLPWAYHIGGAAIAVFGVIVLAVS